MKPSRTLTLRKETLAELRSAELGAVVGAERAESGAPCELTQRLCDNLTNPVCVPTCGPTCTGTSTAAKGV